MFAVQPLVIHSGHKHGQGVWLITNHTNSCVQPDLVVHAKVFVKLDTFRHLTWGFWV